LKSITFGTGPDAVTVNVYGPNDRARLNYIMGFTEDANEPIDLEEIQDQLDDLNADAADIGAPNLSMEFYEGARGRLKVDAEWNKETFAPYANSVTLSKMLLLQEILPNGQAPIGGNQPKTISHLISDLISAGGPAQYYDFALLTMTHPNMGGDIMTTTLPGATDRFDEPASALARYVAPIDSDLWISLIDGDHNWRQDSQTRASEVYHYHPVGIGQNKVIWEFSGLTPGVSYHLQTDWRINQAIIDQDRIEPAHAAFYRVFTDGNSQLGPGVAFDQRNFPDDEIVIPDDPNTFEPAGQAWENIGTFVAGADGKLRVELTDDNFGDGVLNLTPDGQFMKDGDFIVAGRVRLFQENFEDTTEQIITNEDTTGIPPKYTEFAVARTQA
jgi:hypothetical protein